MSAPTPAALRLLVASPDARYRDELRQKLESAQLLGESELSVLEAADLEALLGAVEALACEIALIDGRTEAGLEWCRAMPRSSDAAPVPVLLLVPGSDCPRARAAGATDCAAPGSDADSLADRVHSTIAQHASTIELARCRRSAAQASSSAAAEQAGLADERQFLERLRSMLSRSQPPNDQVAVLCLHLDLERALSQGPHSQDALLGAATRGIKHCIRDRDMLGALANRAGEVSLARLGEAQFGLLLPGLVRPHDAYKIARRLQESLSAALSSEGDALQLECTIGISVAPLDGASAEALLQAARAAVHTARSLERGAVQFATSSMNASAFERLTLESSLRKALAQRELCVSYQAKIEIATGRIAGFEALARWKHPELGVVSPGQFIPVAEETGLILPLGEFVLEEACTVASRWRRAGLPHVRMAVNLSGAHFRAPNLIEFVSGTLARTGLPADALELELTESILLQKADSTVARLQQLKQMGVHLSIDDFGTGYSSLSYLKRFPVDSLKIDQSFIRDVTSDPEDAALTTSIILMGKSLKLRIVAEGVETEHQLQFLRVLECDEAQGYLFGRPMPADDAQKLLEQQEARATQDGRVA